MGGTYARKILRGREERILLRSSLPRNVLRACVPPTRKNTAGLRDYHEPYGYAISDQGRTPYQSFLHAVVLNQVMRQSGQDPEQVRFRDILQRLRNCLMAPRKRTRVVYARYYALINDRKPALSRLDSRQQDFQYSRHAEKRGRKKV